VCATLICEVGILVVSCLSDVQDTRSELFLSFKNPMVACYHLLAWTCLSERHENSPI
jgi:hypothetical protein